MRIVFVDTVGMLALWNTSDQWHDAAEKAFTEIVSSQATLITTSFILLECGNAAARKIFRGEPNSLRQKFEQAKTMVWPTSTDWRLAWEAYQKGEADSAGIIDHISFQVMRRLGVQEAFTNDRHFRAAGFKILF